MFYESPFCWIKRSDNFVATSTTTKMGSGLEARGDVQDAFFEIFRDEFDVAVLNLGPTIHPFSSFAILPVAIW